MATFFNEMTSSLLESKKVIENYNRELEQKVAERTRELRESQERLFQTEKMAALGVMVSGLAHEINNPMGNILGYTQLLLSELPEDLSKSTPQISEYLKIIESSALRCKKIIFNLLDFSRQSVSERQMVDINEVVEKAVELCGGEVRSGNISVIKSYGKDLPRCSVNITQIEQVFVNLIINAYQVMQSGGTLEIRTSLSSDGKMIEISFQDTGSGIEKENLQKVFEPFFTTKTVGKGTGLGLSICYSIVKNHNGDISVESEGKGKGTRFVVTLPYVIDQSK